MMRSTSRTRRPRWRRPGAVLMALVAIFAVTTGVANAADITSAGPLTKITTTTDLNCAVDHADDSHGEFYGDTACATFVTDGTNLYGPAYVPAGGSATGVPGYVPWTPVSQTGPTGSGTAADPYKTVTVVTGGTFTVTQTDSYVVGEESYRTDIQVASSQSVSAIVYRAADCYLQGSDDGLGRLDLGIAPTCVADPESPNPDRIEQFYPLTVGSNHIVDNYDTVWNAVGSMTAFPDTVLTDDDGSAYDNGMGLSWSKQVATGTTYTFSSLTVFSPLGIAPLTVTKTVTPGVVGPGEQVTYTIKVENPGALPISAGAVSDDLPTGFTYVPGSTTGALTADPTITGSNLEWNADLTVPAASGGNPGSITLSFTATASNTPGTYYNSATIVTRAATVIPAIDVAPVTVVAGNSTTTSSTTTSTTSTTVPDSVPETTTTVPEETTTTTVPEETTTTTVPEETTTTMPPVTTAPTTTAEVVVRPTTRPSTNAGAATAVTARPAYTG